MSRFRCEDFRTPVGRLSFARDLFVARENDNGRKKFGGTLIFPKSALREQSCITNSGKAMSFEEIVASVIVGEWGEKGLQRAKSGLVHLPFLPGDGPQARNKTTGELHPGMGPDVFFVRVQANVEYPPKLSSSNTAFVPATQQDVYSGCYGYGVLNAFAWNDPKKGDGVSLGILMFFKTSDGEPFAGSGGGNPDKWIDAVPDAGDAPASTKSGVGAGGLFGD